MDRWMQISEKWAAENLRPSLPANSVVVIDNAPYHSVQVNKCPNRSSRKNEIIDWLVNNKIFSQDVCKVELLDLVKMNTANRKQFQFDNLHSSQCFTVLHLPPYHAYINAIQYAWLTLNSMYEMNITGEYFLYDSNVMTFY